jgi:internalin A
MASPNGSLTNLKPELTNCTKIDDTKKGSEYAKGACKKNIYPYLYWAGNIYSQDYPVIDKGWIVEKKNIATFLQQKITEMGLNPQEKADFLDYWQPELIAKNTPYYRVSFLQTNELNELFPMQVTPQPDTTFRIFLDYTPLMAKPITLIQPQTLNKLTRNGFTMVEWGGLKR